MTAAAVNPDFEAAVEPAAGVAADSPVIEVGWMLVGEFDDDAAGVLRRGRGEFLAVMRGAFPEFDWRVPIVRAAGGEGDALGGTAEAVEVIDRALREREARRWDFAVAFTAGALRGYERSDPMGAPSAAVGCAAASASRLGDLADADPNDEVAARRAARLAVHLLGHLAGLGHAADPADFMHPPHDPADLDRMTGFADATAATLRRELEDVADPRLEEEDRPADLRRGRAAQLRFALRAAWQNRDDVRRIVARIRPWTIPRRLGGLVTAAASTLVILMMTAEAWEAGMSQPPWRVALLAGASLATATAYVVGKQRLLVVRPRLGVARPPRHSEQRSVGNVAVVLAVLVGMAFTFAVLFTVALAAAYAFYPRPLVANWAGSVAAPFAFARYACLAGTVASLGLAIGALGAGFEPRGYVRHVAYVDEEV